MVDIQSSLPLLLLQQGCDGNQLTMEYLMEYQLNRIRDSRATNPTFQMSTAGISGASIQATLLLVLSQREELDFVPVETLRAFLQDETFPCGYTPDNNPSPGCDPGEDGSRCRTVRLAFNTSIANELENPSSASVVDDDDDEEETFWEYLNPLSLWKAINPFN